VFKKHGIAKDQVVTHGYGVAYPADINDTKEGRMCNRRTSVLVVKGSK